VQRAPSSSPPGRARSTRFGCRAVCQTSPWRGLRDDRLRRRCAACRNTTDPSKERAGARCLPRSALRLTSASALCRAVDNPRRQRGGRTSTSRASARGPFLQAPYRAPGGHGPRGGERARRGRRSNPVIHSTRHGWRRWPSMRRKSVGWVARCWITRTRRSRCAPRTSCATRSETLVPRRRRPRTVLRRLAPRQAREARCARRMPRRAASLRGAPGGGDGDGTPVAPVRQRLRRGSMALRGVQEAFLRRSSAATDRLRARPVRFVGSVRREREQTA